MDKIIKASSGQVFALLLSLAIISGLVNMFAVAGLLPVVLSDILYVAMVISNIGWILLIGRALEIRKYGVLTRQKYRSFTFVGILLIVIASIGRLFHLADEITSSSTIQTIFIVYVFISFFWVATFAAKTLKANETDEEIDINDYFGDIFLFVFWPIGVWTIQPRINKLFARQAND